MSDPALEVHPRVGLVRLGLLIGVAATGFLLVVMNKPWELPGGPGFFAEPGASLIVVIQIAGYWVLALCFLTWLLLWVAAPWWLADVHLRLLDFQRPTPRDALALALILLFAAMLRAPLLGSSLHWDEAWTVRRAVVGGFEPDAQGTPHFETVPWRKTLWGFKKPTNHVLTSATARLCNTAWQRLTGAEPDAFHEVALRLPGFLGALLSVFLAWLLLALWGRPVAGLLAALLLALHPWHIQLGVSARAYGLVIAFSLLAAVALSVALRSRRLWAWLAFGAALGLLLWSHLYGIFLALGLVIAALVYVLRDTDLAFPDRMLQLARAGGALTLAGLGFLLVMGPALAQVTLWKRLTIDASAVSLRALGSLASALATGLPARIVEPGAAHPSLAAWLESAPVSTAAALLLLTGLAALGAYQLLRRPREAGAVVAGSWLGLVLAVVVSALATTMFYDRFHAYALPFWLLCVATGIESAARFLGARRPSPLRATRLAGGVLLVVAILPLLPQLAVVTRRPHSGMREAVLWMARETPADALRAGLGKGGDNARSYDRTLLPFESRTELEALVSRARAENRELYVYYGFEGQNRARTPEVFARLDDPEQFEALAHFDAVEPAFVYHVLRARLSEPR